MKNLGPAWGVVLGIFVLVVCERAVDVISLTVEPKNEQTFELLLSVCMTME